MSVDNDLVKEFLATPRGAKLKKVQIRKIGGKPFLDIRDYYLPDGTEEYLPGREGTTWKIHSETGVSEAKELLEAIQKALSEWEAGSLQELFEK